MFLPHLMTCFWQSPNVEIKATKSESLPKVTLLLSAATDYMLMLLNS